MTIDPAAQTPMSFMDELRVQRWDDHRYYHQSRVNQALHLFSACCFLATYALMFVDPLTAALLGWVVAMWIRQIGHFFFEPRGFDTVNNVSFEHKEAIKVGFNLQRKVILLVVWLAVPIGLWSDVSVGGLLSDDPSALRDRVGYAWLGLAALGLLGRTGYLMVTQRPQTGLVWFTKILTDPFNDIRTYYSAPIHLARGEWIDPMDDVREATLHGAKGA
jgi:hypothetical protein